MVQSQIQKELAQLRQKKLTNQHRDKLKDVVGQLSTPEEEENHLIKMRNLTQNREDMSKAATPPTIDATFQWHQQQRQHAKQERQKHTGALTNLQNYREKVNPTCTANANEVTKPGFATVVSKEAESSEAVEQTTTLSSGEENSKTTKKEKETTANNGKKKKKRVWPKKRVRPKGKSKQHDELSKTDEEPNLQSASDKTGTKNIPEANTTDLIEKIGQFCFKCGEGGHLARQCTNPNPLPGKERRKLRSRCFNCGVRGHLASQCSLKPVGNQACYVCDEEGHFARDCPNKK